MLCIIASHANVWNYFSDNIIGAWSVFVFFFISALFIKQDSKKALNYSRFLKLFIPYLLWCLIPRLRNTVVLEGTAAVKPCQPSVK